MRSTVGILAVHGAEDVKIVFLGEFLGMRDSKLRVDNSKGVYHEDCGGSGRE